MPLSPGKNYFELFGLPVDFDIAADDLTARYHELQRRVHPDKFSNSSDQERRLSMQMTAQINEAYQTLRRPVSRGRYLLGLRGVDMNDETDTSMDPVFLMEQIELRESLAEVKQMPEPHKPLAELANQIEQRMQAKTEQFRRHLTQNGLEGLTQARAAIREMQFLEKLRSEVEDIEDDLTSKYNGQR